MIKLFISTLLFLLQSAPDPGLLSIATPKFEAQVEDRVSIRYGLAFGDVNGDGKPDILLVDKDQIVWYKNGDLEWFVIAENLTEFEYVCISPRDITGDGRVEVAQEFGLLIMLIPYIYRISQKS